MDSSPAIKFVRLRPDKDADVPLPRYMTPLAAGMDIYAAIEESIVLERGSTALLATGFAMAIPEGFEAQIRPRSGLAVKHGIGLINSVFHAKVEILEQLDTTDRNTGGFGHTGK
jgi:dUTP pyrophosphatase